MAAAVYDADNRVVASFARAGEPLPPATVSQDRTTEFRDGRLIVVRPVEEAGQRLGAARLRLLDRPPSQRFSRNAGLLLVLGLAVLVVVVLSVAQGALRKASRELERRAEVLDLPAQVEGLRFLLERSLREDIEVVVDLPEGLWRIEADAGELELALLNLAINARDAMPNGGRLALSAHNVAGSESGTTPSA